MTACSAASAFGLMTLADVAPLTLDLENKSKNRYINMAANGLPTHLNAHHMVTTKQTVSEWRLCSPPTAGLEEKDVLAVTPPVPSEANITGDALV